MKSEVFAYSGVRERNERCKGRGRREDCERKSIYIMKKGNNRINNNVKQERSGSLLFLLIR